MTDLDYARAQEYERLVAENDVAKELLEFVNEDDPNESQVEKLCSIADRIDAEMVELPRDAGGEPTHLGDKVYDKDGLAWHVRGVTLTYDAASTSKWVVRAGSEEGDIRDLNPEMLTHTRPDSLERIAEEMDKWPNACVQTVHAWANRIRKIAKRDANG